MYVFHLNTCSPPAGPAPGTLACSTVPFTSVARATIDRADDSPPTSAHGSQSTSPLLLMSCLHGVENVVVSDIVGQTAAGGGGGGGDISVSCWQHLCFWGFSAFA